MDMDKIGKTRKKHAGYSTNAIFVVAVVLSQFANHAASYDECKYMVKVGSRYRLQCSTNLTTAYNLVLRRYNYGIIPRREYHIIDNHTIEYLWENIPRISTHIECFFPDKRKVNRGVSIKHVLAEAEPEEVTNFKCETYDFQYIQCSFHKSEQYFTHTKVVPSDDEEAPKNMSFTLSRPAYDPENQNVYNFEVHSKNCFADRTQLFTFNHLDNVIPGKPNVSLSSIKATNVTLRLTMHDRLYMKKGLKYEIKLLAAHSSMAKVLNTDHLNPAKIQHIFLVGDLYAFKNYTIHVRSKSVDTIDTLNMWSQPIIIKFQTLAKPPDHPPKVDTGSFHVDPDGRIYIYWEMLKEYEHNGADFSYEISVAHQAIGVQQTKENKISRSFMVDYDLPSADYEFSIRSANSNGTSPEVLLKVPKARLPPPTKLRSIYDGNKYRLSWESPGTKDTVESYTVFRCVQEDSTQHDVRCNQNFTFSRVAPDVKLVDFIEENQFAVSANYANGSSGMVWIECTALKGGDIGVIDPTYSAVVNSTAIHLVWALTCTQKTLLKGYLVRYCTDDAVVCSNKTLYSDEMDVNLSDLIPNSKYQIQLSLFSEDMSGPFSQVFREKTSEATPTPPRNLKACNITQNSIMLTWSRPEHLNGRMRYYRIVYNDKFIDLTEKIYLSAEQVMYSLRNLKSYQAYDIVIIAGTISDSEQSNRVRVRTKIADPDMIPYTQLDIVDSNYINISWGQEAQINSPIRIYHLKYESDAHAETTHVLLPNVTSFMTKDLNCSSNARNYDFSIRPVNFAVENKSAKCIHSNLNSIPILANEEFIQIFNANISNFVPLFEVNLTELSLENDLEAKFHYGPWSRPVSYTCKTYLPAYVFPLIILLSAAVSVAIISTVVWYLRRQYITAKDIGVMLPTGLMPDSIRIISVAESKDHTEPDCSPESMSLIADGQLSSESIDEGYRSGEPSPLIVDDFSQMQILKNDYNMNHNDQVGIHNEILTDRTIPDEFIQETSCKESIVAIHLQQDSGQKTSCILPKILDTNGYVNPSVFSTCNVLQARSSEKMLSFRPKMFDSNGYVIGSVAGVNKTMSQIGCRVQEPCSSASFRPGLFDSNGYVLGSVANKMLNMERRNNVEFDSRKEYKSYSTFEKYKKIGTIKHSSGTSKEMKRYSWGVHNMERKKFDCNGYLVNRPKSCIDRATQYLQS